MTTDFYQNNQPCQKPELTCNEPSSLIAEPSSTKASDFSQTKKMPIVLNNGQFLEFQEKVFSIISENNGKLIFPDLLKSVGEDPYKQVLYKALMSLAKQQRIVRIRGIGKKRIEFYYYDTKKLKKLPASAAVSYVQV
jgi:hypothetical protein